MSRPRFFGPCREPPCLGLCCGEHGYCRQHYRQRIIYGYAKRVPRVKGAPCRNAPHCSGIIASGSAASLCPACYQRQRRLRQQVEPTVPPVDWAKLGFTWKAASRPTWKCRAGLGRTRVPPAVVWRAAIQQRKVAVLLAVAEGLRQAASEEPGRAPVLYQHAATVVREAAALVPLEDTTQRGELDSQAHAIQGQAAQAANKVDTCNAHE